MTSNTSKSPESIAYLLAEYANQRVPLNGILRTLLDELDGQKRCGRYLNRNQNARWFNAADLRNHKNRDLLLDHFEFKSPKALAVLKSVSLNMDIPKEKKLVCDHVVPCFQMQQILFEKAKQKKWTQESILFFRSNFYRRCIITEDEDRKLTKSRMPEGWETDGRVFARYDEAGFEWAIDFY